MVTDFNIKNNSAQIRKLIDVLSNDFASSRDANKRKGGLIGLAAASLGLGKVSCFMKHKNITKAVQIQRRYLIENIFLSKLLA